MLVVIPCFNEEIALPNTILAIKKVMSDLEFQICVVDNASTDATAEIAKEHGALVLFEANQGKGFAFRRAINQDLSKFDAIFMVDGDDTYSVECLPEAISLLKNENIDMIIGNRTSASHSQDVIGSRGMDYRAGHAIGNQMLTKLFCHIFQIDIGDTLSGWRLMSPGFVKSFNGGATQFELEAELNVHAYRLNSTVKTIDIEYRGRLEGSESKLNTYKDGFKILRRILGMFSTERPLLAYSIYALPWLCYSAFLMNNVLNEYFRIRSIPNFPSLIASVGFFIVGDLLLITGLILNHLRINQIEFLRSIYKR